MVIALYNARASKRACWTGLASKPNFRVSTFHGIAVKLLLRPYTTVLDLARTSTLVHIYVFTIDKKYTHQTHVNGFRTLPVLLTALPTSSAASFDGPSTAVFARIRIDGTTMVLAKKRG